MKKGFEKGALVILVRATHPFAQQWIGTPQTLEGIAYVEDGITRWSMNPPLICIDGVEMFWEEPDMILMSPGDGTDEMLARVGKPAASKRLTEAEFEAAQDRWIQGVDL